MKHEIENYIQEWENRCYYNGIPDEAPKQLEKRNKVPSYRRICFAILTNDHSLKSLGYTAKKSPFYDALKRIEIDNRQKVKQLKLEL